MRRFTSVFSSGLLVFIFSFYQAHSNTSFGPVQFLSNETAFEVPTEVPALATPPKNTPLSILFDLKTIIESNKTCDETSTFRGRVSFHLCKEDAARSRVQPHQAFCKTTERSRRKSYKECTKSTAEKVAEFAADLACAFDDDTDACVQDYMDAMNFERDCTTNYYTKYDYSKEICSTDYFEFDLKQKYVAVDTWSYQDDWTPTISLKRVFRPVWTPTSTSPIDCETFNDSRCKYDSNQVDNPSRAAREYAEANQQQPTMLGSEINATLDLSLFLSDITNDAQTLFLNEYALIHTDTESFIHCASGLKTEGFGYIALHVRQTDFCVIKSNQGIIAKDLTPGRFYACDSNLARCQYINKINETPHPHKTYSLSVSVDGILHPHGTLHLSLHNQPNSLNDAPIAQASISLDSKAPAEFTFEDLPTGPYVVTAHHDVLDNAEIQDNQTVTDGYGISGFHPHSQHLYVQKATMIGPETPNTAIVKLAYQTETTLTQ